MSEWIARTPEEYIRIALQGARGRRERGSLRQRLRDSPLMDEARFVRDLEEACLRLAYS
jgi:predicted O-linked N-acetylglucosamine transferase (SPINDLY family)